MSRKTTSTTTQTTTPQAFGQVLRKTRESYTMTQQELANHLGLSLTHIHNLETGKRTVKPEVLKKINEVYGENIKLPKLTKLDFSKTKGTPQTESRETSFIKGFNKTKKAFVKYLQETIKKVEAL